MKTLKLATLARESSMKTLKLATLALAIQSIYTPALALSLVSDPIIQPQVTHCRAFVTTYPLTEPSPRLILTAPLDANRACNIPIPASTEAGVYRATAASVMINPTTGITVSISGRSNPVQFTVPLQADAIPVNLRVVR